MCRAEYHQWRPRPLALTWAGEQLFPVVEAVIAGQGLAICSDVLVAPELASGKLVRVCDIALPGYGFYVVHRPGHPKQASIRAFAEWARTMV